jgi:hypothetical protein
VTPELIGACILTRRIWTPRSWSRASTLHPVGRGSAAVVYPASRVERVLRATMTTYAEELVAALASMHSLTNEILSGLADLCIETEMAPGRSPPRSEAGGAARSGIVRLRFLCFPGRDIAVGNGVPVPLVSGRAA